MPALRLFKDAAMKRRTLISHLAALAVIPMTGCSTQRILGTESYTETVSSILISEDARYLVIISPRFHYVFEMSTSLKDVILGEIHPYVYASPKTFKVDRHNTITGSLVLSLRGADEHIRELAKKDGFIPECGCHKNKEKWSFATFKLTGKRYPANGITPGPQYKLNSEYQFPIEADRTVGEALHHAAATPVKQVAVGAAEGVLVIFGVPLLMLAVVVGGGLRPEAFH